MAITCVLFDFAWTTFAPSPERWVLPAAERVDVTVSPADAERIIADFDEALRRTVTDPAHVARDLDTDVHRQSITTILGGIDGVGPDFAIALYEAMTAADGWSPYPDVRPTLESLRSAGARIGIVSNIGWNIRKSFVHHGLADLVDAFVLSYEVGHVKPEPAIWAAALDALGATAGETLMVGDHPAGDGGAATAGIPALVLPLVLTPQQPRGLDLVLSATRGRIRPAS